MPIGNREYRPVDRLLHRWKLLMTYCSKLDSLGINGIEDFTNEFQLIFALLTRSKIYPVRDILISAK
jgi:hypothetical protein